MRGQVSQKLKPFLLQVNDALAQAKAQGMGYEVATARENLEKLVAFLPTESKSSQEFDWHYCAASSVQTNTSTSSDTDHVVYSRKIGLRIYIPKSEKPLPVIIHIHGGGHMCGSLALYDPICRQLADGCQAIVIAVDYRLAPEFPYPAGLDDCREIVRHYSSILNAAIEEGIAGKEIVEQGIQHNGKLFLVGDSAGGALAATLAMESLSDPSLAIDKQVLIYPSVDYRMQSASMSENGQGFLLEQEKIHWYFKHYFAGIEDDNIHLKASPLLRSFSQSLPKSFIITAGCDPLRDEGLQYLKQLQQAKVDCVHLAFEDMIHAFFLLQSLVEDECEQGYQAIADFLTA